MSKICEKCGNEIPEGLDLCPVCGGSPEDAALKSVLDELSQALGGGTPETPGDDPAPNIDLDAETIRISLDDIATGAEEAPQEDPTIILPDLDTGKQEGETLDQVFKQAKPLGDKPQAAEKKSAGKAGNKEKKSGGKSAAREKTAAGKNAAKGTKPSGKNQKKRKNKKDNAAMVGVLIGLIIALLLIGCGVLFMLYQMGFFVQMSDEELLQTPGTVQNETLSPDAEASAEVPELPAEETPVEPAEEAASVVEELVETPEESPEPTEELNCTKFNITGSEYIILYSRGETTELSYVIEPSEYRSKIDWSSSDESIATVNDLGVISARRGGTCTITGECGDKTVTAYITCEFTVPETVLDMNMEDITMTYEGQTADLAIDYDLTDEQIEYTVWESSDPAVATVNENGVVTAVADGTTVITASISDYTASCIVRCVGVTGNRGVNSDDSEYVINYEDVTLTRKGEYFQLTLKSVLGDEMPEFTWTSDDPAVAKVDSKGVVTAVSNGTAYITTSIGQDKFQCIVRVSISD